MFIADIVVRIALLMPRGGYKLLMVLSQFISGLKKYPILLPIAPSITMEADLAYSVFYPLLKYKCYPEQITEDLIIRSFLKNGDCVIDVGANIGYVSLLCAECVGEGTIYSFEPGAAAFSYLNKLASKVKQIRAQPIAVSNISGLCDFVNETFSNLSHIADKRDKAGNSIQCVTIDDWAANNQIRRVDFVKIDAERHDVHVIEGAREVIKQQHPIIEFEAFDMDAVSNVFAMLNSANPLAGYEIFRCCKQYPLLPTGVMTNNWFAIPNTRLCDIPNFLFSRGFLALIHFGADVDV